MSKINLKTPEQIKLMREGGRHLHEIRAKLAKAVKPGVTAMDIEELAVKLIAEVGGKPSFKMVEGYSWATCINVNNGVVHGIPKKETIFAKGDVVSVDVGIFYKGLHTDSATTVYLGDDPKIVKFLEAGRRSLKAGIAKATAGRKIGDITKAVFEVLSDSDIRPIWNLTGHGVGLELHEDPRIPNYPSNSRDEKLEIVPGMTLAIEVMFTLGDGDMVLAKDGWTLRTKDATIAALFEETVAVTDRGTLVLTKSSL